jgi:hypothetical protein
VGEGLEGNFGRGREILGEWRKILLGFEAENFRGFFVNFIQIMVKIISNSSRKHRYSKFNIFTSW